MFGSDESANAIASHNLKTFLSGSAFSAGGMVVGGVLTAVTGIIFARWLQPEGFGVYSLALILITFVGGLGTFGMDNTVARFVAYYQGTGEAGLVRSVFRHGIARAVLLSSVLSLSLFGILRSRVLFTAKLSPLSSFSEDLLIAIPLFALQHTLLQSILGLQQVKSRIVLEKILQPVLRLGLPFTLLWWLMRPTHAAVGGLVWSAVILDLAAAALLWRKLQAFPVGVMASRTERRKWLGYSLPFVFYSLQNFVSAGMGIDVLLVSLLVSVKAAGIYAAVFRFTPVLALARGAADYAFGPRVGVLFGQSDFKSIGSLYKTTSSLALTWTLPVAVVLGVFSQALMRVLFGTSYEEGGKALALLVGGYVIDGATGCNSTLLSMAGKSGLVLLNGLLGGIASVTFAFLLIPRWGIVGAALATALALTLVNTLATLEIWKLYGMHPFSRSMVKVLLAGSLVALLGLLWAKAVFPLMRLGVFSLGVSASVTFFAYFGLLLITRRSAEWLHFARS